MTAVVVKEEGRKAVLEAARVKRHELDIVVPTRKWVETYKDCVKIPAVRVGRVLGGLQNGPKDVTDINHFLLEGGDVYEAWRTAGTTHIECLVMDFDTEDDFLIEHVRCNRPNTTINPLVLGMVADRLVANGHSVDVDLAHTLGLEGTIHQKFMSLHLAPKAYSVLCDLCVNLGSRLTNFILPYYIPLFISRRDVGIQSDLARAVVKLIMSGTITDARFSWPSPEEVEILLASIEEPPEEPPVVSIPKGDKPTTESVKKTEQVVARAHDVVAIPATDKHPTYVVDLKTKRVSAVEEKESVICLKDTGAGSSTSYIFPPSVGRWLVCGGDDDDDDTKSGQTKSEDVKMYTFSDVKKLAEFTRQQNKKHVRGVIFYRPS